MAFNAHATRSDIHSLAQAPRHRLGPPRPRAVRLALRRRSGTRLA